MSARRREQEPGFYLSSTSGAIRRGPREELQLHFPPTVTLASGLAHLPRRGPSFLGARVRDQACVRVWRLLFLMLPPLRGSEKINRF